MNKLNQYCFPRSIYDLYDVLLDEIFFRLPLTSLFKCKSVCKRWDSLISSREFQEVYMFHRMSLKKSCTLVRKAMYVEKSIRFDSKRNFDLSTNIGSELECSNFSVLAFPHQLNNGNEFKHSEGFVLASSNGLLLCSVNNYHNRWSSELYVCSPIIKQWIKIPNTTDQDLYLTSLGVGFTTQLQGLTTVTNYKVIIALEHPLRFKIFSSETGRWETHYVNLIDNIWAGGHRYVAVVNKLGILHWTIHNYNGVLAYDPSNRDWCSVINLPRNNNNQVIDNVNMPIFKDINALEENLRHIEMFRTPGQGFHLYIWTLDSYDDRGIWHLDHKTRLYDFRFYMRNLSYKIVQFDYDILYIWICNSKELLTYDFRTQKLNDASVGRERNWLPLFDVPESWALPLRLPVWPTTIKLPAADVEN